MKKLVKRAALGLGGIVLSGLVLFTVADVKASSRLSRKFRTHQMEGALPVADAASVARGKHLVEARYGCAGCHGSNLGGGIMIDEPPIGLVRGPNLTSGKGSRTAKYTLADWDRIVRHGVKPDGTAAVMPSDDYFKMSDAELVDIAAYVRSVPPVDNAVPAPSFGPVGKVLLALGKFPIAAEQQTEHADHPAKPPESGDNAEFGAHLAAVCTGCHRSNLGGGKLPFGPPDWPAAGNLTQHANGLGDWSYEDFERALTQGISKDGRKLRPPMAELVPSGKAMLPTERKALWTYLRSLPAVAKND